jgi:hypothetical protein
MRWRLARIPERVATRVGESRRQFLGQLGRGALAAAAALSGLLLTRSGGLAGTGSGSGSGTLGACYYTSSGTQKCEQLTQAQCSALTGSTWTPGPCTFALPEG